MLYGDPQFTGILVFMPERHYADPDMGVRLYHDMHTGKWWWETQVCWFSFFRLSITDQLKRKMLNEKRLERLSSQSSCHPIKHLLHYLEIRLRILSI